jgi:hypothetical protein
LAARTQERWNRTESKVRRPDKYSKAALPFNPSVDLSNCPDLGEVRQVIAKLPGPGTQG